MCILNEHVFPKLQTFNQALANTDRKQQNTSGKTNTPAGSPVLRACLLLLVPQSQKYFSNTDFLSCRKGTTLNAFIAYF